MFKHIPLAWLQLTQKKARLLVAIAGIAFADMLIFVQLGFQDALYDAAVQPHRNLQADLVTINPHFQTLFSVKSFSRDRLYQTLGYDGVKSVSSVYISTGQWRNPTTRIDRAILVWGIEPSQISSRDDFGNNWFYAGDGCGTRYLPTRPICYPTTDRHESRTGYFCPNFNDFHVPDFRRDRHAETPVRRSG